MFAPFAIAAFMLRLGSLEEAGWAERVELNFGEELLGLFEDKAVRKSPSWLGVNERSEPNAVPFMVCQKMDVDDDCESYAEVL